jgi:hypothetical protein
MATVTITTTGAEDARIATAFGAALGFARNATAAEVKAAIIAYIKQTVIDQESQAQARAAAQAAPIAPT